MRSLRDRSIPVPVADPRSGVDPDMPVAGYYRRRMVSGGVWVGVRIWFGAPLDPVTGDEMDRAPRWQAQANGRPIDIERVWPSCARDPIDAKEYAYLARLQGWAEEAAPDSPFADPTRKIDLLSVHTPTPF